MDAITNRRTSLLLWGLGVYWITTLVSMAVMGIGLGFLLAVLALLSWKDGGFRARWWTAVQDCLARKEVRIYLSISVLLSLCIAVSLVGARWFPLDKWGPFPEFSIAAGLGKIWYLFFPVVLLSLLEMESQGDHNVLKERLGWAYALLSLLSIGQFFTGWPRPQPIPTMPTFFHATLFLGHHLSVASIWIFPFFMALDEARLAQGRKKLFWAFVTVSGAICLFLTYSRMVWISIPVGVVCWILLVSRGRRRWLALGSVVVCAALASQHPTIQQRFADELGTGTRRSLWNANIAFLKHRPWTGVGFRLNHPLTGVYLPAVFPTQSGFFYGHAHNNALEMLGGTGLPGFVAWLAWVLWAIGIPLVVWWRSRHGKSLAAGLVAAWIVFHLNGVTQVNFWEGKVLHQIVWAMAWGLFWYAHTKRRPA